MTVDLLDVTLRAAPKSHYAVTVSLTNGERHEHTVRADEVTRLVFTLVADAQRRAGQRPAMMGTASNKQQPT